MKVLQVIAGREKGGAENFFSRLAVGFANKGIQQHLITRDIAIWNEQFVKHKIPVTHTNFSPSFSWFVKRKINKVIEDFQPDIVLTWMSRATKMTPNNGAVKIARLGGYYNMKYYKDCDFLIGNTEDIITYLTKNGWPAENSRFLQNFVNEPSNDIKRASRVDYNTPENAPLIFALGRLHINKGFDILIKALKNVPQAYLWLAGVGPLETELKDLAVKFAVEDRIRFIGWQYDATPFFKAADIFVCPSRHEPFGNVVAEAFAHKMPVISTASQGPSVMIKNNENGLLTPIDDSNTLAEAIQKLIDQPDLRQKLAKNGYSTYKADYSEEVVVNNYLNLFEDLKSRNSRLEKG